jgi:predicted DNA-binding protein YlxM (UPF0122 family)
MNPYTHLVKENPDKYPSRLGAPWDTTECNKLLNSIKMGKSIDDIAKEHGRTNGGIQARLRYLANEYYNKDYDFDDIEELTGLSQDAIADSIARYAATKERSIAKNLEKKKKREKPIKEVLTPSTTTDSNILIINTLKEMNASINKLINLLETR